MTTAFPADAVRTSRWKTTAMAVVLTGATGLAAVSLFLPSGFGDRSVAEIAPARQVAHGQEVVRKTFCREHPYSFPAIPGYEDLVSREQFVTNDAACREYTVPLGDDYLIDSPYGIRVVLAGTEDAVDYRAEAHYGQLLMILGEVGVSSSTSVTTASGRSGTVADIYADTLMRFSLSMELEFIGCALAYWHTPQRSWTNSLGDEYSFDDLILRLMENPLGKGSCGGCHVPYAIVVILQTDRQYPILSDPVRQKTVAWVRALTERLESRQLSGGGWDSGWGEMEPQMWGD